MVDYSKIQSYFVLENYNLGLAYSEGYVFFKVLGRELFPIFYDPKIEISSTVNLLNIGAGGTVFPANPTFIAKQLFGSGSSNGLNTSNILKASKSFHVYQAFIGIQPSAARVFYAVEGTEQKELDEGMWGTNTDYRFGYVNGWHSSFEQPTLEGEFWVAPNVAYTWAVANPMPYTISPVFMFVINRLNIAVIKDPQYIQRITQGVIATRLAQIGGLAPPKFNMQNDWRVSPIPINATFDQIKQAVGAS